MDDPERRRFVERVEGLREEIVRAFPVKPVPHWPRGKDRSMEEVGCRKCLAGKPWDRVDREATMGLCSDCVLDHNMPSIEHTAYYLPAFLDTLLVSWPGGWGGILYLNLENLLTYTEADASLPKALTSRQRMCVADFLEVFATDPTYDDENDAILYRLAAEDWSSTRWDVSPGTKSEG